MLMEKKKILIVTTTAMTIATILKGQPKYLNEDFTVLMAASGKEYFTDVIQNEGIEPYYVPMTRGINPFFDIYSLFAITKLLISVRPDLVHSYTPKAGLVTMLAAWFCRVPVRVHTFTGLIFPSQSGYKKQILKLVDKLICACSTIVIPEGNGVKNELLKNDVTKKVLNVLGNGNVAGIDTEYFRSESDDILFAANRLRYELNLNNQNFVFVFVGRLNRDKGLDELVAAFQLLNSDDSRLLIVGALDSSSPISSATLSAISNSTNINWLGFMSDIRPALAISDVLVLPSYREGFPNVLIQAGAMKLPCISTNVCGADEIIVNEVTGIIVPIKNTEALTAAMKGFLNMDQQILNLMGEKARARIALLFEQKSYREILRKFYLSQFEKVK